MKQDVKVKEFVRNWERLGSQLSLGVLDKIGKAYLQLCLGLGNAEITAFLAGDSGLDKKVGLMHAGVTAFEPDLQSFWEEVSKLAPEAVGSVEDLVFLSGKGRIEGVWAFLDSVDPIAAATDYQKRSGVLNRIFVNAHVWK